MTELTLHMCDKYDKIEQGANCYITLSTKPNYIKFTDNPIQEIHELQPQKVIIESLDFDGQTLALYINTLVYEGYELDVKRAVTKDRLELSVWGHSVYFKRKDNKK